MFAQGTFFKELFSWKNIGDFTEFAIMKKKISSVVVCEQNRFVF